jgi:hypothetical protein
MIYFFYNNNLDKIFGIYIKRLLYKMGTWIYLGLDINGLYGFF